LLVSERSRIETVDRHRSLIETENVDISSISTSVSMSTPLEDIIDNTSSKITISVQLRTTFELEEI